MDEENTVVEIEAAVFRRLVAHLQKRTDVQNIDLMNLAGFCRNCLAKWYAEAAAEQCLHADDVEAEGVKAESIKADNAEADYEAVRERIYGMPYAEWKARYQTER